MGFFAFPVHLSNQSSPIKTANCRYCLHQYLRGRLSTSDPETDVARYCPLDLYSGTSDRIVFAIKALWHHWKKCPPGFNNLRIFVDGLQVDPQRVR